ncbi:hypothetical protein PUN28_009402 [Cardiocondyla obscurior]|uniref:Uncharacterized protein n=1 Tax=Cardiocondyla obscurior TaxID=286306 RepID=A0AAW2FXP9_9HYME
MCNACFCATVRAFLIREATTKPSATTARPYKRRQRRRSERRRLCEGLDRVVSHDRVFRSVGSVLIGRQHPRTARSPFTDFELGGSARAGYTTRYCDLLSRDGSEIRLMLEQGHRIFRAAALSYESEVVALMTRALSGPIICMPRLYARHFQVAPRRRSYAQLIRIAPSVARPGTGLARRKNRAVFPSHFRISPSLIRNRRPPARIRVNQTFRANTRNITVKLNLVKPTLIARFNFFLRAAEIRGTVRPCLIKV